MIFRGRFQISILVTLMVSVLTISLLPSASAAQTLTLIAEESFDYTGNVVGKNGGFGFSNAWDGYGSYDYGIRIPGHTYPGLTTSGGHIYGCTATPNQYCAITRQIPIQSSGVLFLQFIAKFGSQYGAGTPNIRLKDDAGNLLGGIGSNAGTQGAKVSILDNTLTAKSDGTGSAGVLNNLNFIIVKIDFTRNRTSMWINPDLSTFSYLDTPTEDAFYQGLAPALRTIEIIARGSGSPTFDEFKVYKISGLSAAEESAAAEEARKKRDEERAAEIKASREKINAALVSGSEITLKDLKDADLPLRSVASLNAAYKELTSIKYSLAKPLSTEAAAAIKYKIFMKYAMIERITGISNEPVYAHELVKFGVIDEKTSMKQLSTYRLMKLPLSQRDSMQEISEYFTESTTWFETRKNHIVSIINKIRGR